MLGIERLLKVIWMIVGELPPRGTTIQVIGNRGDLESTRIELDKRSYGVGNLIAWSEELKELLKDNGLLEEGGCCENILWNPSPCLLEAIDDIEATLLVSGSIQNGRYEFMF